MTTAVFRVIIEQGTATVSRGKAEKKIPVDSALPGKVAEFVFKNLKAQLEGTYAEWGTYLNSV